MTVGYEHSLTSPIYWEPGAWEVIKKLHLEEDLLQTTDIRPTDGPGIMNSAQ